LVGCRSKTPTNSLGGTPQRTHGGEVR
jgi:hypothetical protein